jgi:DNA polymerase III delta subunit
MAKPVYALLGADSFLQLQHLEEILRQLPGDAQRSDLDGERCELSEVLDELRSFAMFGGGKLVTVRAADTFLTRFREQLEAYVLAPSEASTLVLRLTTLPSNQRIYKAITKVGQIIDCNPPKLKDIPQWIISRAPTHKVRVDPDAARLLSDYLGDDLGRIDNELAKLAIGATSGRITVAEVNTGVSFQREQEMWDMTGELAAGRPAEALRRWRRLVQLDPSAEFRAVTWLGMWLENVRKALAMRKSGMNPFSIGSALRIWPRENIEPFMRTAGALGENGVAHALDLLATVDYQSKSGVGDAATNVERFILDMANMDHQPV